MLNKPTHLHAQVQVLQSLKTIYIHFEVFYSIKLVDSILLFPQDLGVKNHGRLQ